MRTAGETSRDRRWLRPGRTRQAGREERETVGSPSVWGGRVEGG